MEGRARGVGVWEGGGARAGRKEGAYACWGGGGAKGREGWCCDRGGSADRCSLVRTQATALARMGEGDGGRVWGGSRNSEGE